MNLRPLRYTIGEPFIELDSVESSNNYAMEQVQNGHPEPGTVWFAREQTAGKGQRGKHWIAQEGLNIIMSAIIPCSHLTINKQFALSAAVAVACRHFFARFAGEQTKVKYPNDIYWNDRKAAGILIENVISGKTWQWAVIGIGMNINQVAFPEIAVRPVSLKQITGRTLESVQLAKELCAGVDHWVKKVGEEDEAEIMQHYNEHLFKQGEESKFKQGTTLFTAKVSKVDEFGMLWLDDGQEAAYNWGELEWVM